MQPKDRNRLLHMLEAARTVRKYMAGKSIERFYEDDILRLALTTLFSNIGEAARKISEAFKLEHPEFEWEDIIAFRHRLVHGYDVIDYDSMWDIIQTEFQNFSNILKNWIY